MTEGENLMNEQSKSTPIAELTPEQFNARFPVGTRVMTREGEQDVRGKAVEDVERCNVPLGGGLGWQPLSELSPIVTLGSLNVGDEFRWHGETPSAGVYWVKDRGVRGDCGVIVSPLGAFTSMQDCVHSASLRVQVVALNLAQDRPEVFPGSMLREGDVVEMVGWDTYDPRRKDDAAALRKWNERFAPARVVGCKLMSPKGEEGTPDDVSVYSWRLVPATIPAPAPTEPCPAPVEEERVNPELKCGRCGVPESKYTTLYVDEGIATLCDECFPDSRQRPNGTFLPPKPPRKLPAAVAYHLSDDADASGLPSHD